METIQRAIIIAAGEGTRMRPVTNTTPKPLVKVNGTRLVDTSINALKENGIHEIYIVAGYKKEQFHEAYANDPDVTVIDNPYYKQGNNITSMYMAREHLPGAFVVEGDLIIRNKALFAPQTDKSAYCGTFMHDCPEWALKMKGDRIVSCDISGGTDAYRNLGISMWTQEDGAELAEMIRSQFEDVKDWSIYWDEIPLFAEIDHFDVGVRKAGENDLTEVDTVAELAQMDPSYQSFVSESDHAE